MPRSGQARPAAPRLPRFSPTRLGLYLFCPRAYHFYYQRGLRWGAASPGHAFGGNLHRALQAFHNQGGADRITLPELLEQFRAGWSPAGFASPEDAAAHLAAGEAVLERYHRALPEPGRETVATERTVQRRYPEFVLFGKVDRLDRRADGSLEVIDYKSGRLTVTEAEVRESLALQVYQLLVAREHPGVPVRAGILCLRTGAAASVLRAPEELDAVEQRIAGLVRAILEDEVMAPLPGPRCRECLYPRICPPGRRWLDRNAPPPAAEEP